MELLKRLRMAQELTRVADGGEPITPERGASFIALSYGADKEVVRKHLARWVKDNGVTFDDPGESGADLWVDEEGEGRRDLCAYLASHLKTADSHVIGKQ